jgi:hypothetical protein
VSVAGAPERTGYVPSAFAAPLSSLGGDAPAAAAAVAAAVAAPAATRAPSSSASSSYAAPSLPLAAGALVGAQQYDAGEGAAAAAARFGASMASASTRFASSSSSTASSAAYMNVNPGASLVGVSNNSVDEFASLFASHETWFKNATQKRADVYASLQSEAGDILRMLQDSEARSQAVIARISELDAVIAAEKERLAHA